jgi:Acetyltransferases
MGVIVRKFHLSDYDRIIELWKEGNLPLKPMGRDSREEIERQIKLPQVIFLVAEFEGQIVGTVMATHDGRKGWINRLAVAKDFRGRGLGQLLVREAEKELEKQGLMIFAALIEEDNEPSINLFKKLGYEYHSEIKYFTRKKFSDI